MGIDEGGDEQPRLVIAAQLLQLLDAEIGVDLVATAAEGPGGSGVQRIRTVGLWADEPGEAIGLQPLGFEVDVLEVGITRTDIGVGGERVVRPGLVEIGVGDVPLALPVGVVPGVAEPPTEGRHSRGVQPVEVLFDRALRCPGGLRDAVQ